MYIYIYIFFMNGHFKLTNQPMIFVGITQIYIGQRHGQPGRIRGLVEADSKKQCSSPLTTNQNVVFYCIDHLLNTQR
jgi:hypothetical protein